MKKTQALKQNICWVFLDLEGGETLTYSVYPAKKDTFIKSGFRLLCLHWGNMLLFHLQFAFMPVFPFLIFMLIAEKAECAPRGQNTSKEML